MIDRYLIRYFLAVIEHGNFSKAAANCHVSQPTLSVGIAKLERDLDRALFIRSNRRVELTPAGAALALHARRIEAEFALAERSVLGTQSAGTVRLGVLSSIPMGWIEQFLARQRRAQGLDRVEIIEGRERELLERLMRGRIDVALTLIRPESRLERQVLFSEGYALAMAACHPLAGRETIAASELASEPMIVRRHCELLPETSRHFTAQGVRPFFPARTTSDDRALAYVRSGAGVTIMPDCFSGPGVVRPRLAEFDFTRTIGLLFGPHADAPAVLAGQTVQTLMETIDDMTITY
jgi:DNA-binding transcriptional LysR family regulator